MNIIAKDLYHPWIERFLQHAIYHNDEPDELMIKTFWSKLKKWSVHPPNRKVKWPPSSVMQKNGKIRPAFFFPRKLASGFPQSGVKRVAWPPPPEESLEEEVHSQQYQQYQQPVYSQGLQSVQKPVSPVKSVKPPSPSPQLGGYGGRRPEEPPLLAHTYSSTQGIVPPSPPAAVQSVPYHPVHFEPPKTTVTLLPTAPVRQKPAPVYVSQPVTATVQGGTRMRGDQKWPPESVKQQAAAENEARVALAKGPACRPLFRRKRYSSCSQEMK
uniref:Uncharacterized protein n=1 Tax=Rhodnius prolixus TaxID=13249 RepID=T1H9T3_RHOPR